MTTEQVIEVLSEIRSGYNCFDEAEKPFYHALSMAIEALTHFNSTSNSIKNELNELSCSEKPNESDLISRQDAIYYVKQATIGETDVMKAWVKAQTHLMRLPSVQLKPKTAESGSVDSEQPEIETDRTIGGMIYRQDAIDALSIYGDKLTLDNVAERIYGLPSAQPEIIRCKDCKWWDKSEDSPFGYCMAMKHGYMSANWEIGIYRRYKGDFYCADAERRTDEIN